MALRMGPPVITRSFFKKIIDISAAAKMNIARVGAVLRDPSGGVAVVAWGEV
jgi:hypothetical protein